MADLPLSPRSAVSVTPPLSHFRPELRHNVFSSPRKNRFNKRRQHHTPRATSAWLRLHLEPPPIHPLKIEETTDRGVAPRRRKRKARSGLRNMRKTDGRTSVENLKWFQAQRAGTKGAPHLAPLNSK